MVGSRIKNHVEVHAGTERRSLHLFEGHFLYVNVDVRSRCIRDEFLDDVVFAVGIENAVGELAVEEVEGLREIGLNRVAVAAVVEGAKLGQEILGFGILGLVFEIVVVDRFSAAQIVNADHQRTEVLERPNRLQVHKRKTNGHKRDKNESNFEIGVRHHGITVLFEIEALGIVKTRIVVHSKTLSTIPTEVPPAVPLKM